MRVYVSGTMAQVERAKTVIDAVAEAGHIVTFNWTTDAARFTYSEEPARATYLANTMRDGVRAADALVFLHEPKALGALVEFGMALAPGKVVAVVGKPRRESIFYYLADRLPNDEAIVEWLARLPRTSAMQGVEIPRLPR